VLDVVSAVGGATSDVHDGPAADCMECTMADRQTSAGASKVTRTSTRPRHSTASFPQLLALSGVAEVRPNGPGSVPQPGCHRFRLGTAGAVVK
jgi:hypothetical protein